jgi:hypothetical protein
VSPELVTIILNDLAEFPQGYLWLFSHKIGYEKRTMKSVMQSLKFQTINRLGFAISR